MRYLNQLMSRRQGAHFKSPWLHAMASALCLTQAAHAYLPPMEDGCLESTLKSTTASPTVLLGSGYFSPTNMPMPR